MKKNLTENQIKVLKIFDGYKAAYRKEVAHHKMLTEKQYDETVEELIELKLIKRDKAGRTKLALKSLELEKLLTSKEELQKQLDNSIAALARWEKQAEGKDSFYMNASGLSHSIAQTRERIRELQGLLS